MSKRLVLLLALTCGAAVGNMYYAQPLLHTIGGAFSVCAVTAAFALGVWVVAQAVGGREPVGALD